MIELITTPKNAIIFAVIATLALASTLTVFIWAHGLAFISAAAFCVPLSIVVVGALMLSGGIVFHAHRIVSETK